ncbi:MAG: hypothetical protein AAFW66_15975, partial [Pseudomonadota bacterium]
MEDLSPKPGDLEPIETASRDELSALQLQRLKWSLSHAYENVPHYKKSFDDAGQEAILAFLDWRLLVRRTRISSANDDHI